jgi:hypothetical protein
MSEQSDKRPLCWTCYDRGIKRAATRCGPGSLGPIWCVQCACDIADRRSFAEAATDKRPEGVTAH